jgi:phage FluMu gp28-like protein
MTLSEIVENLEVEETKKHLFRNLAAVIENNVEENIAKTPFELSAETGVPYEKWTEFLETTEVNGWLNDTVRIIAKVSQRKKLKDLGKETTTTQDVNAYKVLDNYNSSVKPNDNSSVVIMYLPNPNDNYNKN